MSRTVSLQLKPTQATSLKQMQRLMMAPHMQQAISYLQMPIMELAAAVEKELEQNPVLDPQDSSDPELDTLEEQHRELSEESSSPEKELAFDERDLQIFQRLDEEFRDHFAQAAPSRIRSSEEDKWQTYQESLIQAPITLFESLMQQAHEAFPKKDERAMAEWIIGNLSERGFLESSLEEIAHLGSFPVEKLEKVLQTIQTFEPLGVGAQDLRESLLIQMRARHRGRTLAYTIVESHFQDLLHNRIPLIQRHLKCSSEKMKEALELISKLDFHPGSGLSASANHTIRPDVMLKWEGDQLKAFVEEDGLPTFRFNRRYLRMLEDEHLPEEAKEFIRKKILSAKWLFRNIYQRNDTLERIAAALAKHQREFFLSPEGKLIPMKMKTLADELEVHESTIARTVANKYIDSPRGLLPLRTFFTSSLSTNAGEDISSRSVQELLLQLIKAENKLHPLSDELLASKIQEKGIQCARRTVAKYRSLLKIGNAHQRKQF